MKTRMNSKVRRIIFHTLLYGIVFITVVKAFIYLYDVKNTLEDKLASIIGEEFETQIYIDKISDNGVESITCNNVIIYNQFSPSEKLVTAKKVTFRYNSIFSLPSNNKFLNSPIQAWLSSFKAIEIEGMAGEIDDYFFKTEFYKDIFGTEESKPGPSAINSIKVTFKDSNVKVKSFGKDASLNFNGDIDLLLDNGKLFVSSNGMLNTDKLLGNVNSYIKFKLDNSKSGEVNKSFNGSIYFDTLKIDYPIIKETPFEKVVFDFIFDNEHISLKPSTINYNKTFNQVLSLLPGSEILKKTIDKDLTYIPPPFIVNYNLKKQELKVDVDLDREYLSVKKLLSDGFKYYDTASIKDKWNYSNISQPIGKISLLSNKNDLSFSTDCSINNVFSPKDRVNINANGDTHNLTINELDYNFGNSYTNSIKLSALVNYVDGLKHISGNIDSLSFDNFEYLPVLKNNAFLNKIKSHVKSKPKWKEHIIDLDYIIPENKVIIDRKEPIKSIMNIIESDRIDKQEAIFDYLLEGKEAGITSNFNISRTEGKTYKINFSGNKIYGFDIPELSAEIEESDEKYSIRSKGILPVEYNFNANISKSEDDIDFRMDVLNFDTKSLINYFVTNDFLNEKLNNKKLFSRIEGKVKSDNFDQSDIKINVLGYNTKTIITPFDLFPEREVINAKIKVKNRNILIQDLVLLDEKIQLSGNIVIGDEWNYPNLTINYDNLKLKASGKVKYDSLRKILSTDISINDKSDDNLVNVEGNVYLSPPNKNTYDCLLKVSFSDQSFLIDGGIDFLPYTGEKELFDNSDKFLINTAIKLKRIDSSKQEKNYISYPDVLLRPINLRKEEKKTFKGTSDKYRDIQKYLNLIPVKSSVELDGKIYYFNNDIQHGIIPDIKVSLSKLTSYEEEKRERFQNISYTEKINVPYSSTQHTISGDFKWKALNDYFFFEPNLNIISDNNNEYGLSGNISLYQKQLDANLKLSLNKMALSLIGNVNFQNDNITFNNKISINKFVLITDGSIEKKDNIFFFNVNLNDSTDIYQLNGQLITDFSRGIRLSPVIFIKSKKDIYKFIGDIEFNESLIQSNLTVLKNDDSFLELNGYIIPKSNSIDLDVKLKYNFQQIAVSGNINIDGNYFFPKLNIEYQGSIYQIEGKVEFLDEVTSGEISIEKLITINNKQEIVKGIIIKGNFYWKDYTGTIDIYFDQYKILSNSNDLLFVIHTPVTDSGTGFDGIHITFGTNGISIIGTIKLYSFFVFDQKLKEPAKLNEGINLEITFKSEIQLQNIFSSESKLSLESITLWDKEAQLIRAKGEVSLTSDHKIKLFIEEKDYSSILVSLLFSIKDFQLDEDSFIKLKSFKLAPAVNFPLQGEFTGDIYFSKSLINPDIKIISLDIENGKIEGVPFHGNIKADKIDDTFSLSTKPIYFGTKKIELSNLKFTNKDENNINSNIATFFTILKPKATLKIDELNIDFLNSISYMDSENDEEKTRKLKFKDIVYQNSDATIDFMTYFSEEFKIANIIDMLFRKNVIIKTKSIEYISKLNSIKVDDFNIQLGETTWEAHINLLCNLNILENTITANISCNKEHQNNYIKVDTKNISLNSKKLNDNSFTIVKNNDRWFLNENNFGFEFIYEWKGDAFYFLIQNNESFNNLKKILLSVEIDINNNLFNNLNLSVVDLDLQMFSSLKDTFSEISGLVNLNIELSGKIDNPSITGSFEIKDSNVFLKNLLNYQLKAFNLFALFSTDDEENRIIKISKLNGFLNNEYIMGSGYVEHAFYGIKKYEINLKTTSSRGLKLDIATSTINYAGYAIFDLTLRNYGEHLTNEIADFFVSGNLSFLNGKFSFSTNKKQQKDDSKSFADQIAFDNFKVSTKEDVQLELGFSFFKAIGFNPTDLGSESLGKLLGEVGKMGYLELSEDTNITLNGSVNNISKIFKVSKINKNSKTSMQEKVLQQEKYAILLFDKLGQLKEFIPDSLYGNEIMGDINVTKTDFENVKEELDESSLKIISFFSGPKIKNTMNENNRLLYSLSEKKLVNLFGNQLAFYNTTYYKVKNPFTKIFRIGRVSKVVKDEIIVVVNWKVMKIEKVLSSQKPNFSAFIINEDNKVINFNFDNSLDILEPYMSKLSNSTINNEAPELMNIIQICKQNNPIAFYNEIQKSNNIKQVFLDTYLYRVFVANQNFFVNSLGNIKSNYKIVLLRSYSNKSDEKARIANLFKTGNFYIDGNILSQKGYLEVFNNSFRITLFKVIFEKDKEPVVIIEAKTSVTDPDTGVVNVFLNINDDFSNIVSSDDIITNNLSSVPSRPKNELLQLMGWGNDKTASDELSKQKYTQSKTNTNSENQLLQRGADFFVSASVKPVVETMLKSITNNFIDTLTLKQQIVQNQQASDTTYETSSKNTSNNNSNSSNPNAVTEAKSYKPHALKGSEVGLGKSFVDPPLINNIFIGMGIEFDQEIKNDAPIEYRPKIGLDLEMFSWDKIDLFGIKIDAGGKMKLGCEAGLKPVENLKNEGATFGNTTQKDAAKAKVEFMIDF